MRIGFLHFWTLRMRRGIETLTLSLSNELAEAGHEVHIFCASQQQRPLVLPSADVRVHSFRTPKYFQFAAIVPFYAIALARQKLDVLVVYFADFGEGPAVRLLGPFLNTTMVLYFTFPFEAAPHRFRAYKKWAFDRRADVLLADAKYTGEQVEQWVDRPVAILPSGTDPDRFRPNEEARLRVRKHLGYDIDDLVLLSVAALESRKGVARVVEVTRRLVVEGINAHLLVVGNGPELATLRGLVNEAGLGSRVRFEGSTFDLVPYYQASDVFVMLPDAEAGSVACLEAMATGLPVVVSKTGGFGDVVLPNCGFLADPTDFDTILLAVRELALAPDKRVQMGSLGRKHILEEFSWAHIAQRFVEIVK